jgi:hypothetical protein
VDDDRTDTPAANPGCTVQLAEHRDGWIVSVITTRASATFHSYHPDKQTALATAIAAAVAMRGDLMVVTKDHGVALLPVDQLATNDRSDALEVCVPVCWHNGSCRHGALGATLAPLQERQARVQRDHARERLD